MATATSETQSAVAAVDDARVQRGAAAGATDVGGVLRVPRGTVPRSTGRVALDDST